MGLFDKVTGNNKVSNQNATENNKAYNKLKADYENMISANEQLTDTVISVRRQLDEVKKSLSTAEAKVSAQNKIISDLQKQNPSGPSKEEMAKAVSEASKQAEAKAKMDMKEEMDKAVSEALKQAEAKAQKDIEEMQALAEQTENELKAVQADLTEKNSKIATLEQEVESVKSQLQAQKTQGAQVELKLSLKQKELEAREQALVKKENDQDTLESALLQEKLEVQQDRRSLEISKQELEASKKITAKLEKDLAEKEQKLLETRKALEEKEQILISKEVNLDNELTERRQKVEAEIIEKAEQAEKEIAARKKASIEEVDKLKADTNQNILSQRGQAEIELVAWKEKEIKTLTDAYYALRVAFDQDIADKRQDLMVKMADEVQKEKDYRLQELNKEIAAKREALDKEQEQLKALQEKAKIDNDTLQKQMLELQAKQEELNWLKLSLDKRQSSLDARSNGLDKEVAEKYKAVIDSYEKEIADLNAEHEKLSNCYNDIRCDLDSYMNISSMFPGDSGQRLMDRLTNLENTKIRLEQELADRPESSLKDELSNLKRQHEQLSLEKAALEKRNTELQDEHTKYNSLLAEKTGLDHELQCTKVELETARQKILFLEAEVKRLSSSEVMQEEYDKRLNDIRQDLEELKGAKNPVDEMGNPTDVGQPTDEIAWLNEISRNCFEYGIAFPKRILYAFHTALKISDWSTVTVLAGVSGTGKSELPHLYSVMGRMNFINVPVQPNWDSQESMLGYFNSIDNKFDAQPALRFLVQCTEKLDQCMGIVLLDEMNLAHVEYYFAEFLSKLELRRGAKKGLEPCVDVKLGAGVPPYPLRLKRNILWCGTMNQDETTKSLSDKVLDRGIVINFPRPKNLKGRKKMSNLDFFVKKAKLNEKPMLSYATWSKWRVTDIEKDKGGIPGFKEKQIEELNRLRSIVEEINNCLGIVGRALGHRVWQSIEFYIANYPEVIAAKKSAAGDLTGELKNAMHIAFEDQLVQKVMPKLRGIDTRGTAKEKCLDPIKQILINEGFNQLQGDFDKAMQLGYGQFMWCSAEFIDADDIAGVKKETDQ